eukprot:5580716-Heterocapsa_arctica.AAC.1
MGALHRIPVLAAHEAVVRADDRICIRTIRTCRVMRLPYASRHQAGPAAVPVDRMSRRQMLLLLCLC